MTSICLEHITTDFKVSSIDIYVWSFHPRRVECSSTQKWNNGRRIVCVPECFGSSIISTYLCYQGIFF